MTHTRTALLGLIASTCLLSAAHAQEVERYVERVVDTSTLQAHIPDDTKLAALEQQIAAQPRNLDHYFNYATLATTLREYEKAAAMYERMLSIAPDLPRIKLELAMVYMQQQRFDQAERMIEDALGDNAPEQVRRNIDPILEQIKAATRQHHFSGSLSMGAHHDSNANSAPGNDTLAFRLNNGSGTPQDILINLDKPFQAKQDAQFFTAASLNHTYRLKQKLAKESTLAWTSSATYYHNEYDNLDELNIQLASVRTGPTLTTANGALKVGASAGYNHIILDNHSYQRQYIGELSLHYMLDATKRLRLIATSTTRDYINSPTNRELDLRDGDVKQLRAGLGISVSKRDYVDAELTLRNEDTKRIFFDNRSAALNITASHQFDEGWFMQGNTGIKSTNYNKPDPSISLKTRKELEFTAGASVGKQFDNKVTATVGYEYRDIEANITNYSYDNHRVSSTLGVRF